AIWGTGLLPKIPAGDRLAQAGATTFPVGVPAPGGSRKDRWFILGALALIVASTGAGFLAHKRKRPQAASTSGIAYGEAELTVFRATLSGEDCGRQPFGNSVTVRSRGGRLI